MVPIPSTVRASTRTVSGRFLSLSSLLSKHWLMMGFIELHMVCEAEEGSVGSTKPEAHVGAQPTPVCLCLPHLLQVPEEKVVVFIQKPWKRRTGEVREGSLPAPWAPASGSLPVTL